MTEYNGQTITYDKIGNPLTYHDGMIMTWKRGRQLTALQIEGNSIQYKYDSDSIRTSKIVNGVVHTYEYLNGLLMHETRGEQAYDYYYDANGQLYAVSYKLSETDTKKVYYFTHNWRGDIVGIYNGNGDLKATYEYDAWGNVLSIEDANGNAITSATHIANLNPFRYRGYYMDTETGLYYLMSRYYDPVTHRFVNADGYFSTGQGLDGVNMFSYCGNSPINNADTTGEFALSLVGWAIAITATVILSCALIGIVSNPSFRDGCSNAASSISNAISNAANNIASNAKSKANSSSKAKDKTDDKPRPTVIYRYGKTNPGNLTPKEKDKFTGLSFSTTPPPLGTPAAVTTMEELNATGMVIAIRDKPNHVSVIPAPHMGTLIEWIETGSSHPCTAAVKSVVVKWDGGY